MNPKKILRTHETDIILEDIYTPHTCDILKKTARFLNFAGGDFTEEEFTYVSFADVVDIIVKNGGDIVIKIDSEFGNRGER